MERLDGSSNGIQRSAQDERTPVKTWLSFDISYLSENLENDCSFRINSVKACDAEATQSDAISDGIQDGSHNDLNAS